MSYHKNEWVEAITNVFKEGWNFHAPNFSRYVLDNNLDPSLLVDSIRIGLHDAVAIIQENSHPTAVGHWPHSILDQFLETKEIVEKDETVRALGNGLAKLMATYNKLLCRNDWAHRYFASLNMTRQAMEMQERGLKSQLNQDFVYNPPVEWWEEVDEFLKIATQHPITLEERVDALKRIRENLLSIPQISGGPDEVLMA